METQAEKKFNADYRLLRLLFFSKSNITAVKAKNWIRTKGNEVLKQIEKELTSDFIKNQFSRQSSFEQEELQDIHEKDGYEKKSDE